MFGLAFYFLSFPVGQEIYKNIEVNKSVSLYITQVNAGAMTSFSYHYYLYDEKYGHDFMNHIDELTPFMITNDDNATVAVKEGHIYLNVHGDIYSFRNTTSLARVHLTAAPY